MIACPSCGYEAADEFAFCPKCATALAPPRATADERKVVTTLFCDLVGYTAMSEAADPEEVDAVLRRYNEAARAVIEDHGGVVEKFIGDAVVGVFGVPAVREDDAARAVRAGLHMVHGVRDLTRPDGGSLQVRVGVNTGRVLLRLDVAPDSGESFLVGDAVNVAARLQSAAPAMGVVVGALTHRLTAGFFAYEALPPLDLKGKAKRVQAWLAKAELEDGLRGGTLSGSVMVGRDAELDACLRASARLRGGSGGLLLITGEAGIGKSRLIDEMHSLVVRQQGCAWLEGRTLSFGRSISYWPFLEIIQRGVGIESDDGEEARWTKLSGRITGLFGEEAEGVLPYLATLLSLSLPDELAEKVRYLDGEAMGRQVYRVVRLFFARLALERPQVVAFEDVHWLDASSAALIEHLLPLVFEVPILFCCVARPEGGSALARLEELARGSFAECLTEIRLRPLSAAESTSLVQNLTQLDRLPAQLRDAVLAKAEGNPFFVEEIVRSLIDFGGLVRSEASGGFRVTTEASLISIPDTLQGVIMARVDRLDEELKQVLRLASVIGRAFFFRVLAAVAEAEQRLDRDLAALEARELVLERAREPELEYIFKHALVQEATYESILLQKRRELHREVAVAIETLFSDRLEDFFSLLAYHYTKAEDWEKAQEYLFKSADQAGTIAADAEALEHYEKAMDAYSLAFGDRWDPLERAAVEHKMGDALYRTGEHERAREYLFRALAAMGYRWPRTPSAVRRATVWQVLRQLAHRIVPSLHRSTQSRTAQPALERFWIYHSLTFMDAGADQSQLLLALLLALNDVESAALDWPTAASLAGLGYACDFVPLRRISRFYHRRALRLAERAQEPFALATVHWLMGFHEYWTTGDWAKARDFDLRAADEFQALGRFREWGTSMIEAVNVMVDEGRLAEALALCERIVTLAKEAGDPVVVGWGLCRVGNINSITGDQVRAEQALRAGIDSLLAALQPADAVSGFGWLALCLLRQGRADEAVALLGEQDERIHRYGIAGYFLRGFHAASALIGLAAAERVEAAERKAALHDAGGACRALRKVGKADICSMVTAYRLEGTYAWLRGHRRRAESHWRSSLAQAERLGARYEGALTEFEVGRLTGDPAALQRAAAAFASTGARFDLARTQELLRGACREPAVSG